MQIFAASYLLPISSPPVAGGAIAVADGQIVDVGPLSRLKAEHQAPVREFPGCVIMPGLVNAHTHLELTHFPSWKIRKGIDYAPRTYVDWVLQVIKIRRALSLHELELSVREGIRIALESGTTTVGEILTDLSLLPLYEASQLSGRLFFEAIGQEPGHCASQLVRLEEALGKFDSARFQAGLSPHAPHTLAPAFLQNVVRLARKFALPVSIHLAESAAESAFMFDSTGSISEKLYPFVHWEDYLPAPRHLTSTAYLDELGVLGTETLAVHCVQINLADAEILKKRGVTAVVCPRSNERLVVGKAPLLLLKKLGIPLALGTDSLASNDSLSMFDEMRFLLQQFPDVVTPSDALQMATMGGASALGFGRLLGSLEPGKKADFLVLDPGIGATPAELPQRVIEGGEMVEVFIDGTPLTAQRPLM